MTDWACPRCHRTVAVRGSHLDEIVAIDACKDRHERAHRAAEKAMTPSAAPEARKRASRPTRTGQTGSGDPARAPTPGKGTAA